MSVFPAVRLADARNKRLVIFQKWDLVPIFCTGDHKTRDTLLLVGAAMEQLRSV